MKTFIGNPTLLETENNFPYRPQRLKIQETMDLSFVLQNRLPICGLSKMLTDNHSYENIYFLVLRNQIAA